jgi:predicted DNA-binding WGR domain protein
MTKKTAPVKAAKSKPAKAAKPAKTAKPAKAAKSPKPAKAAKPPKPAKAAKPPKPAKPAKTTAAPSPAPAPAVVVALPTSTTTVTATVVTATTATTTTTVAAITSTTTTAAPPAPVAVVSTPAPAADVAGVLDEATLNWTDLTGAKTGATALGSNKFYKARITEGAGGFVVTFTYGRVGQAGQVSIERAPTLDGARRIFKSKIQSKIAKGYRPLEMRSEKDELAKAAQKGVTIDRPKAAVRTREFHPEVEKLLEIIYGSAGKAAQKGLSSSAGASNSAPLGNLHDSQIDRGADLLEALDALLEKASPPRAKLLELTNEYLSNIPRNIDHARVGGRLDIDRILLDSEERITKEREFLTLLRDLYLQREVFAQAASADSPFEVWYDGLQCDITHAAPGSDEFEKARIAFDEGQSPKNANFFGKLQVLRVWQLERRNEKTGFETYKETVVHKPNATGVVLGWHGTRTENLMGISRSGLLMPENLPKGVVITGKAFGMGIYHAPRWADSGEPKTHADGQTYARYNGALKSMNYTSMSGAHYGASNTSRVGHLFLEELALGVPEVHLAACWNKKRPEPGHDYIYANAFGNPQLAHDEVVTFHENASRVTHLLEVGFR